MECHFFFGAGLAADFSAGLAGYFFAAPGACLPA